MVSGRGILRAATEQFRRDRRVELYTELIPRVLPDLEAGHGTTGQARNSVEGIIRAATATSPTGRRMDVAESERREEIKQAGARCREYDAWLDTALG
jgi:hypothetical protein